MVQPSVGKWAVSIDRCESCWEGVRMPRYAPNRMSVAVKRCYFELIRTGLAGSAAAAEVGVAELWVGVVRRLWSGESY
jgi:hypothetical protein